MRFNKPVSMTKEFFPPSNFTIKPIESIAELYFNNGALIMIYCPNMSCYKIHLLTEENIYGEEVFKTNNKEEAINRFTALTGELLNNEEEENKNERK